MLHVYRIVFAEGLPSEGVRAPPPGNRTGAFRPGCPETGWAARTTWLAAIDQIESVNRAKNILSGWIAGLAKSVSKYWNDSSNKFVAPTVKNPYRFGNR
jgi:hypothetical protein